LIATLKRGIEFKQFQSERLATGLAAGGKVLGDIENRIIGNSPAIQKLIQQVKKLATVRSPVLLQGENGTGKTRWPRSCTGGAGGAGLASWCASTAH
jgi:two-component system response regulator HydG